MRIAEGEKFKHKFTGLFYEVKVIKEDTCILESIDSPYRMWYRDKDLELFFEKMKKKKKE